LRENAFSAGYQDGYPCPGVHKELAARVHCTGDPPPPAPGVAPRCGIVEEFQVRHASFLFLFSRLPDEKHDHLSRQAPDEPKEKPSGHSQKERRFTQSLNLGCPAGKTIDSVIMASFGTPSGSCASGGFKPSTSCDSAQSVAVRRHRFAPFLHETPKICQDRLGTNIENLFEFEKREVMSHKGGHEAMQGQADVLGHGRQRDVRR
jgi:hypothetical protein